MDYLSKLKEEQQLNHKYEELSIARKELIGKTFMLMIEHGKEYIDKLIKFNEQFQK